MVKKSVRIHETEEGIILLAQYEEAKLRAERAKRQQPQPHQRQPQAAANPPSQRPSSPSSVPPLDPRTLAIRVLKMKDYYDILGVSRTADETQIKRAFRLSAVKLHPDKNTAPEAIEAFKKLNTAYQCLSDASKRRTYDKYGNEEGRHQMRSPFGERGDDLSADDIMNMFFTPHGARRTYRANTRNPQREQKENQHSMFQFLGLLPFLFLVLFAFLSVMPSSYKQGGSNLFRLQRESTFVIPRKTATGLSYWVTPEFHRFYGRDYRALGVVESQVESSVRNELDSQCKKERLTQKKLYNQAKKATGSEQADLLHKAAALDFPACDKLQSMFAAGAT
eukprot:gb/GEZN01010731.1/.p1 GENE.gb/GEZN01010731.1/~~gb/GEZN01010731.1/.p1  ORF type:complete len:370 (+),score=66.13 gb/GEZN01010731.1/:105-1112(+)